MDRGGFTISGPEQMAFFHLARLKSMLKLELAGLQMSRGPTAYSQAKNRYGLKGTRESVLAQLETMVNEALAGKVE